MKVFWSIFEKLRYLVYAFCLAIFAGIGAGVMAGDIDRNAVFAWIESRALGVMKHAPVSNVLYKEAIARYERTLSERYEMQNDPKTSSLQALKQRQKLDVLRANRDNRQIQVDRMSQDADTRMRSQRREVLRPSVTP